MLQIFSDDMFSRAFNSLAHPDDIQKQYELQLGLLKMLDGMVEKVAEELPRKRHDTPPISEQDVVTYACCSFLVKELSNLYNKDFSRVSRAAHAAQNSAKSSDGSINNNNNNNNTNTNNNNTLPPIANLNIATILSASEYELIFFMLRILGHVTSFVDECNNRLRTNGEDLRTNLGKEGLLALIIGIRLSFLVRLHQHS